jgi:hypothetical protein
VLELRLLDGGLRLAQAERGVACDLVRAPARAALVVLERGHRDAAEER